MELAGAIIAVIGSLFLLLAALGLIRMPDVFNRMQAGTKATTLGSFFFFLGISFAKPEWLGKAVLLIVFIIFTNPVSSHALARAARNIGISLGKKNEGDALAEDEEENSEDGE